MMTSLLTEGQSEDAAGPGKRCFKCGATKPRTEFYRHPMMGDGLLGKCKDCTKADVREREARLRQDPEWVAGERRRALEKYYRLYRPANPMSRAHDGWTDKEKARARNALSNAVRDGRVIRPTRCEQCGSQSRIQGHHEDYHKPLDVWWLCVPCHVLADAGRLTRSAAA